MKTLLTVMCLYICVSFSYSEKGKKTKQDKNGSVDSFQRKTFKSKEDVPKKYNEEIKKLHGIINPDFEYYDITDNNTHKTESKAVLDYSSVEYIDESTDMNDTLNEIRELDKKFRLETLKYQILTKLGFSSSNLPNITAKTIPRTPALQRLIDQFEMQSDQPYGPLDEYLPEDDYYGQMQKAFTIAQPMPSKFGIHFQGAVYFDISESVTSRKIRDATLWVYVEKPVDYKDLPLEMFLYVIQRKGRPEDIFKGPARYKKISSSGWYEFRVTNDVHQWIKHSDSNRGIMIQALDKHGRNLVVTPDKDKDEEHYPLLEMSTMPHSKSHRSKRSYPRICSETVKIESCCRYPLRVNFIEYGWDFVIAPSGYDANYCSGECRYRHVDNNPQAYIIQQTPGWTGPCCTSSEMRPLSLLYFDHKENVLFTKMQKMIVERCACA